MKRCIRFFFSLSSSQYYFLPLTSFHFLCIHFLGDIRVKTPSFVQLTSTFLHFSIGRQEVDMVSRKPEILSLPQASTQAEL